MGAPCWVARARVMFGMFPQEIFHSASFPYFHAPSVSILQVRKCGKSAGLRGLLLAACRLLLRVAVRVIIKFLHWVHGWRRATCHRPNGVVTWRTHIPEYAFHGAGYLAVHMVINAQF